MLPEVCRFSPRAHCTASGRCEPALRSPHQQAIMGLCFRDLLGRGANPCLIMVCSSLWWGHKRTQWFLRLNIEEEVRDRSHKVAQVGCKPSEGKPDQKVSLKYGNPGGVMLAPQ